MKRVLLLVVLSACPAFAQHSVVLTWNASTDAAANPSLTYNVYRSTVACPASGVPAGATKVGSAVAALTYTDSTVQVGTNCYYVTSQLNGAESVGSNTAPAVLLPASPTGVVVKSAN